MSNRSISFYIGNLRRSKRFYTLNWHHFLMADADRHGNLLKRNILVQYIGCVINGQKTFLLLCQECNDECSSLQQILIRGNLSMEFYDAIIEKYCIHCKVCLEFKPSKIFPLTDGGGEEGYRSICNETICTGIFKLNQGASIIWFVGLLVCALIWRLVCL